MFPNRVSEINNNLKDKKQVTCKNIYFSSNITGTPNVKKKKQTESQQNMVNNYHVYSAQPHLRFHARGAKKTNCAGRDAWLIYGPR